jgi:hypothetical protein
LGQFSAGVILVRFHAIAWCVDDEDSPFSRSRKNFVHARRQLSDAIRGVQAMM